MVGRLVEQQEFGTGQQQAGQGDPHAPATGEAGRGIGQFGVGEAQTAEQPAGFGLGGVAAHGLEAILELAVPLEGVGLLQTGFEVADLALDCLDFRAGSPHLLEDGSRRLEVLLLVQKADPDAAGDDDAPLVGLEAARHDPEHRGLAAAVRTDEAYPFATTHVPAGAREEELVAEPLLDVDELEHSGLTCRAAARAALRGRERGRSRSGGSAPSARGSRWERWAGTRRRPRRSGARAACPARSCRS